MSERPIPPAAHTVDVPWRVGTEVATARAEPRRRRGDRRHHRATRIEGNASRMRALLESARVRGAYTEQQLESMEARVAFDERRAAAARRVALMSRRDLEARETELLDDLGGDIVYLATGVPIDRVLDSRLLDELAEVSLIQAALAETEE